MTKGKKKVLLISVMDAWGGGEEFILKLTKNIPENDFYIVSAQNEVFKRFMAEGLSVIRINSIKKFYRKANKWNIAKTLKIFFNIMSSTSKILPLIFFKQINLIIANGNFAGLYALPVALLTRKNLWVVQHLVYEKGSTEQKFIKLFYRYSNRFIAVSNSVKENILMLINKSDEDKISVIYNGINLHKSYQIKKTEQIDIGIIGSIIPVKGIIQIIETSKELLEKHSNVHLQIYGTTRENDSIKYFHELKDYIRKFCPISQIHFNNFLSDKNILYNSIDILVSFSTIPESFSYSILEAMSYGKIVISANAGGPKEFINNELNGFLIPLGDKSALSKKLVFCVDNLFTEEFDKIRNEARKTVVENFSIDIFTEKYRNLFNATFHKIDKMINYEQK